MENTMANTYTLNLSMNLPNFPSVQQLADGKPRTSGFSDSNYYQTVYNQVPHSVRAEGCRRNTRQSVVAMLSSMHVSFIISLSQISVAG